MHCNWPLNSFVVVNVSLEVFIFSNLNYSSDQLGPNNLSHSSYHLDSMLGIASSFVDFIGQMIQAELLSDGRSVSAFGGNSTPASALSFLRLVSCFASRVGLRSGFGSLID